MSDDQPMKLYMYVEGLCGQLFRKNGTCASACGSALGSSNT